MTPDPPTLGAAAPGVLTVGRRRFAITSATFRRITQSASGPGWDVTVRAGCIDDADAALFPDGVVVEAEASPLPLDADRELAGQALSLAAPWDDATGEPYVALRVVESHEVSDVRVAFVERDGARHRVSFTGTVARGLFRDATPLAFEAWLERLADHAYPG